jgi:hypothetical protein
LKSPEKGYVKHASKSFRRRAENGTEKFFYHPKYQYIERAPAAQAQKPGPVVE